MKTIFKKLFKISEYKTSDYGESIVSISDIVNFDGAKLQENIIETGLEQVEKRMHDILETKDSLEEKAMKLFTSQTGVASILLTILSTKVILLDKSSIFLVLLGVIFLISGSVLSLFALQIDKYGSLGMHPANWLQRNVIANTDINIAKKVMSMAIYSYIERIDKSICSNENKAQFLRYSTYSLIIAIIPFIMILILKLFY